EGDKRADLDGATKEVLTGEKLPQRSRNPGPEVSAEECGGVGAGQQRRLTRSTLRPTNDAQSRVDRPEAAALRRKRIFHDGIENRRPPAGERPDRRKVGGRQRI